MSGIWCLIVAYLLGSIPTGYLVVRLAQGRNIQEIGSGNIGATNVVRAMGIAVGLAVLVIDAGKGFLAVWIAGQISGQSSVWMSAAAVAVMAGNAFPVFLKLRGGKTLATAGGAFLLLTPMAAIAEIPVFLGTVAITRHISAGSIVVGATFWVAVWIILHPGAEVVIASIVAGGLLIWRHRDNIRRLRAGTESVFSWRRQ